MMPRPRPLDRAAATLRAGFTLIEMMLALTVVTIILIATAASLQREADSVSDLQRITYAERLVQELFGKIEQRLEFGRGFVPSTTLDASLGSASTGSASLASVAGFPNTGMLVIDPGTALEERVAYDDLDLVGDAVITLQRGQRGTSGYTHPATSIVLWEGIAQPVEDQVAPPPATVSGLTDDLRGNIWYRGDGVGFSYQVPVDPARTGSFVTPTGVRWGARVGGQDVEAGSAALVYVPVGQVNEGTENFDINSDGDLLDTFDLGRIVERAWDGINTANGTSRTDLIAPIILQEVDNYGSDLDGDSLEDPMFLWTPESGRLRIRLFALVGDLSGREVVRRFETVLYLRNGSTDE
ncbi:MAG: prepilin-type N-terminal cleavage/methylation domain-containing protein [Planctomycetota bacterium]